MEIINEATIKEVTNRLVSQYNPETIYLFGSYAWGTPDAESDLDLLVVVDEYKKERWKMMSDGHKALLGLGIFKDLVLYTKDEFERAVADKTTLCSKVAQDGKILYAKA